MLVALGADASTDLRWLTEGSDYADPMPVKSHALTYTALFPFVIDEQLGKLLL
jgi:hypothetical protein